MFTYGGQRWRFSWWLEYASDTPANLGDTRMNYPFIRIPGVTVAAGPTPTFAVGNTASAPLCCNDCAEGTMSVDYAAKTKINFDYTAALPAGVNVNTVQYSVTQPDVNMLVVTDVTLQSNVSSFQVSGGEVGTSYTVEGSAVLSTGELWIDRIVVTVTACGVTPYTGPDLLYGPGPVIISSTLYYTAKDKQILFSLGTPDNFGRNGLLADANVNVYVNGSRLVPSHDYIIDVPNNKITLTRPAGVGESVTFDLLTPTTLPPPISEAVAGMTLYYHAVAEQTVFPLDVPDINNNIAIIGTNSVLVYRNGNRQVPGDTYTVQAEANTITFTYPLGVGDEVVFDLMLPASFPPQISQAAMEALTISSEVVTGGTLPPLSYAFDGSVITLFINGQAFSPIGPSIAFVVVGKVITWQSTLYSIPAGAAVIAVYTHA